MNAHRLPPASIEPPVPDHPLQPSAAAPAAALGTATASLPDADLLSSAPLCSGSSRPAKISGIHRPQFSEPTARLWSRLPTLSRGSLQGHSNTGSSSSTRDWLGNRHALCPPTT